MKNVTIKRIRYAEAEHFFKAKLSEVGTYPQSKEHASGAAAAATGAVPAAGDAAGASDAVDGRRTIALRIDACRSTFCCFGSGCTDTKGSAAAGIGRFDPETQFVK